MLVANAAVVDSLIGHNLHRNEIRESTKDTTYHSFSMEDSFSFCSMPHLIIPFLMCGRNGHLWAKKSVMVKTFDLTGSILWHTCGGESILLSSWEGSS